MVGPVSRKIWLAPTGGKPPQTAETMTNFTHLIIDKLALTIPPTAGHSSNLNRESAI